MKNIEEFVELSVKIEKQSQRNEFGYYPFHMFVEKNDGKIDIIVIADISSVGDVYKIMDRYIKIGMKRLYCAVDFPARMDIKNDFVGVFKFDKNDEEEFEIFAIPYSTKDGTVYERITKSNILTTIVVEMYNSFNNKLSFYN